MSLNVLAPSPSIAVFEFYAREQGTEAGTELGTQKN